MARADWQHCESILRQGSRSFYTAGRLLPIPIRQALAPLYAFCRYADDAIDEQPADDSTVTDLERRLDRIYSGRPDPDPVDRAFALVIAQYAIPRALPQALLEGFRWEVSGRAYETLDDVEAYAARVAGTVGAMVTLILGRRDAETLARAVDLGVAMQLTNIARDVGEDARRGRLYLPLEWMREAGVDPATWLADPRFHSGIGKVVSRLLERADFLYRRADDGIARLPEGTRVGIRAARLIYAAIGGRIADAGFDSVTSRAHTSLLQKLILAARALPARWWKVRNHRRDGLCTAPEAQFLVEAVTSTPEVLPTAPVRPIHLPARVARGARVEAALRVALGQLTGAGCPPKLAHALRDALFPAGHRLRPTLCHAVADALGEDEPQLLDATAVALEMLHCASLIQDDLPAFDDAQERRGRPALHAVHGEAVAILASDALILGALNSVAMVAHLRPERTGRLIALLSAAAGAPRGLVAGQAWESERKIDLSRYHEAKTGALFEASTMAAALACGHEPEPWRALGRHLGLAYQTADDLKDAASPDEEDASLGRPNAALELGHAQARARLRRQSRLAMRAIPAFEGAGRLRRAVEEMIIKFEAVGSAPATKQHSARRGAV
jgi:phytoene synthase